MSIENKYIFMNTKHEHCYCGKTLKKLMVHENTGWIIVGYYCKSCDKMFEKSLMPLVTYRTAQWVRVIDQTRITIPQESLPKELQDSKKDPEKTFDNQVRHNEIVEAAGNQEFIK